MKQTLFIFILLFPLQFLFAQTPPVANNDYFSIDKNNQVTLPVLSNDFDADGDSLIVSIVTLPLHGTANSAGNQLTYLPAFNFVGSDSFTYSVCDSLSCDTAIVVIVINDVNNAPVALNDSFTVPEGLQSNLPVTSNDYEPDGEALTITILRQPAYGSASATNGQVTYVPFASYFGPDSFIYVICDPLNLCDTATVYIFVNGSNLPPVAVDDNFLFTDTLTTTTFSVLTNDSDPENDLFTIQTAIDIDSANYLGNLNIDTITGQLLFFRNGIACGTETFGYIICDYSECDTGYVTVSISCPESIFLTEGFSPDGDGINDNLIFTRLEYFSPAILKVFNRYGTLVFENEDYKNDWDGTYLNSGNALPDGTYFYTLQLADSRKYNNYLVINR